MPRITTRIETIREKARIYYAKNAKKFTEYQRKHREQRRHFPKTRPDWKHISPKTQTEIQQYFDTCNPLTIPFDNEYTREHRTELEELKVLIQVC